MGEIELLGPEMFVGYWDDALNESSFTDDGWFRTGDIGFIDAHGYLTITGRVKDIIVRGGENISAKEVEDLLFEHPLVAEVALVGMPDPVMVERICAFVVPTTGAVPTREDLVEYLLLRRIAKQKLPENVVMVDALPKTSSGKVQKYVLREWARALAAGGPRLATSAE